METDNIAIVTPEALAALKQQREQLKILDVRSASEYREGHIPGASLLPLDQMDHETLVEQLGEPGSRHHSPVYLTCHSGMRAEQGAVHLQNAGYREVVLLQGGTEGWKQAGLPLDRCGGAMSLERQVQIVIGTLLLMKVTAGFTLHEMFFLVGALIGAGLILAGATRWCGLARLMAMMPWNRNLTCTERATGPMWRHYPLRSV